MREKDTSVGEEEDNGRKKERKKERMKDEVDFLLNKSMSVALQQIRNLFLDLVIEEIDFPGGNGTN